MNETVLPVFTLLYDVESFTYMKPVHVAHQVELLVFYADLCLPLTGHEEVRRTQSYSTEVSSASVPQPSKFHNKHIPVGFISFSVIIVSFHTYTYMVNGLL